MTLWQDLRFAARLLARDRWFTCVAVGALALGIGVNNTFFTVVNALCLRGPLSNPTGIVHVGTRDLAGVDGPVSHADFEDVRSATQSLTDLAAYAAGPVAIGDDDRAPDRATRASVSANAFRVVRESPILGRDFVSEDDRVGAPPVVILATNLWKSRYSGDPAVIGRTVRIDGHPVTVIGVMRDGFRFPNDADLWQPLSSNAAVATQPRNTRALGVVGRLANGVTIAEGRAELEGISQRLSGDHPETNTGIRLTVAPINERFTSRITDPAWMAFITAGALVLLVACANVANLLLARSVHRSGEMAVRLSIGASRSRVVQQLLVECTLLAAIGGVAGLLLSIAGARVLSSAIPDGALPSWMELTMDGRVLAVLVGVCVATVFVFGFVPALQTSKPNLNHALKDHGRSGAGARAARRWTTAFLTVEFALTFVLIAAVLQSVLAFRDAQEDELVIDTTNLLTTWVTLPAQKYATAEARAVFHERLVQDAGAIADVSSAAIASVLPFGGASQRRLEVADNQTTAGSGGPTVSAVAIGRGYFETVGVHLDQGRDFTPDEASFGRDTAIVNRRVAHLYFPTQDPIGRRVRLLPPTASNAPPAWLTIVGVSPNIPQRGRPEPVPVVYRPLGASSPATVALLVRGRARGANAATLRERVRALDPDLPLYRTLTMEQVVTDSGWNPRVASAIINAISSIALLLAVVGLYGVTAHGVASRTREFGIRVALGAAPRHVSWLVARRALVQLAFGLTAGVAATIAWNRLLSELGKTDPIVLATAAATIVAVSAVAFLGPARRAAHLNPVAALRFD